ncbi:MAG: hypothetical protein ACO3DQ_04780 [Cephaloticoccus sp.]
MAAVAIPGQAGRSKSEEGQPIRGEPNQVDAFVAEARRFAKRQKGAADYQPGKLL